MAAMYARAANFPMALAGWFAGCTMIWSALFTRGKLSLRPDRLRAALLAVFAASGAMVIQTVRKLWV